MKNRIHFFETVPKRKDPQMITQTHLVFRLPKFCKLQRSTDPPEIHISVLSWVQENKMRFPDFVFQNCILSFLYLKCFLGVGKPFGNKEEFYSQFSFPMEK